MIYLCTAAATVLMLAKYVDGLMNPTWLPALQVAVLLCCVLLHIDGTLMYCVKQAQGRCPGRSQQVCCSSSSQ
jgi:hypothetical protein